ncbi:MAG: DUF1269 domain-containing protein [Actinobacteria bacterium]|nr:DUF1269 domain-containing protein [Actinomycetota bacterium]
MSGDNATGPVDYLVLEFPEQDDPTGDAATELRALIESGVIRLFDIVAVHKSADGEHRVVDLGQFSKQDDDGFAFFAGASSGLLGIDDVESVASALEPRTFGIVLVYENAWAEEFVSATLRAGGALIASQRIPAPVFNAALDEED